MSEFAKKAWADLLAYEEIKAADEANLSDLLERPYEDLVTEELIDSLPGPKIEDLEPEDVPDKVKGKQPSLLRWKWKADPWIRYPPKMRSLRTSRWTLLMPNLLL